MPGCVAWGRLAGYRVDGEWGSVFVKGLSVVWPGSGEQPGGAAPALMRQLQSQFAARTMAAACGLSGDYTMPARKDQLWHVMFWQRCAQITSGRLCTSLVRSFGKCIFWGSNFSMKKCSLKLILLQADFLQLVSGRQRHPGLRLKLKCMRIICP